jgi:acyl-coenzyme A thioesterase PaaI-like protein
MNVSPTLFKRLLNLYPPYIGAGIKVEYVSKDWRELHVSMALRWYNRNAVGTHFGGSLYAMIDPHVMLLLMQLLGKDYQVWDKSASIEFVKASKERRIGAPAANCARTSTRIRERLGNPC